MRVGFSIFVVVVYGMVCGCAFVLFDRCVLSWWWWWWWWCGLDRYENPFVTASSRQIIGDINALSRQLRDLNVPRPAAMFRTLFQPRRREEEGEPWFQVMQAWSDIEDIYDSESFGELTFGAPSPNLIGSREAS